MNIFVACQEKVTVISTIQYLRNITVSSSIDSGEKVITDGWKPSSTDKVPKVYLEFINTVTITDIIFERPTNIAKYT